MKLAELRECFRVAAANTAQQVFCLMFELVQVGTNGKLARWVLEDCFDQTYEPPHSVPVVRYSGERRFALEPGVDRVVRWTQSCPRTGCVLYAGQRIALSAEFKRALQN